MTNTITKTISTFLLLIGLSSTVFAGAEVVVTLNTGAEFKWQFEEFEDAAEFMADRVESGRCSPKVANIEIRSVYIDGLDDVQDKFAYFHGIELQRDNG